MILLSILFIPLIAIVLTNIVDKKSFYVKIFPLLGSLACLLLIFYYSSHNNLLELVTFVEYIHLYDIFPKLGISMSFSISKISIILLILANITISTALFSTFNINKRLN